MSKTEQAKGIMMDTTFGIEIETVGISKSTAAKIIAAALGGTVSTWDGTKVEIADGRKWSVVFDGSLNSDDGNCCEVVSPICKGEEDIKMVQRVVRALRNPARFANLPGVRAARVNRSCGIHVHIGVRGWEPKAIMRLVKNVYSQEDLLIAMLQCSNRTDSGNWCARVSEDFMSDLPRNPNTLTSIGRAWYRNPARGCATTPDRARHDHYNGSRYRGLNLHNLWFGRGEPRGTVELRYFNPTLHAGRVRSYIQLALALAAKAKMSRGAVARKRTAPASGWTKYDARVAMIKLNMIGDEFATARKFLQGHLPGSSRTAGTGRSGRGGQRREELRASA